MYFSLERKISQSLFEEGVYMDLSEMTPSCPTLQGPSVVRGTSRSARVPRVFIIGMFNCSSAFLLFRLFLTSHL